MTVRHHFACFLVLGSVACSSDEQPAAHTTSEAGTPDARPPRKDAARSHEDGATKDAGKEAAVTPPPKRDAGHEGGADAASTDGSEGGSGAPYPTLLSDTGLYDDIAKGTLGSGVRAYEVHYPLWSDGAEKKRWVYIPPGEKIDTTDMDFWNYPVGMKAWKEFSVGGKRIETRLQWKIDSTDWVMIAYQWKDDLSDAVAVPLGVQNAKGTTHDIPAVEDCMFCHGNMKDRLLGFNAIQLSHNLPGLKITDLMSENLLTKPPAGPFTLPGSTVDSDALGYLHGNCGDCHNKHSGVFYEVDMELWESTSKLDTVVNTNAYRTAVNKPYAGSPSTRITPGDPANSKVYYRMGIVGSGQMPPVARETVDTVGHEKVRQWIMSLQPITDGGTDAGGAKDGG